MLIVLLACFVVLAVWLDSRDFEKDRAECMDSVNKSREKGLIVPSGKPVTPKDTGSCTNINAGVLSVRSGYPPNSYPKYSMSLAYFFAMISRVSLS